MIRSIARAGLTALALTVSGCALTFDSSELGVPTSLAESAATPVQGTAFSVTRHPVFLLWGAVPVASPSAEDVLAGQVGTASRIANRATVPKICFLCLRPSSNPFHHRRAILKVFCKFR